LNVVSRKFCIAGALMPETAGSVCVKPKFARNAASTAFLLVEPTA